MILPSVLIGPPATAGLFLVEVTMAGMAHDLARGLGQRAEAVCRHYLSNGRRSGRYWLVGDVDNAPGRSLFVRLVGPETGRGAALRLRLRAPSPFHEEEKPSKSIILVAYRAQILT